MTSDRQLRVGVLALQGAFREHLEYLAQAVAAAPFPGVQWHFCEVKTPAELERCDGLVIPGGELTAMLLIAQRTGMVAPLREYCTTHPVWGTCAGLILLATTIVDGKPDQVALGALDVEVRRNAFGRQLDLFTAPVAFPWLKGEPFETVFIRAPVVTKVEPGVEVLSTVERGDGSKVVVAVRQRQVLGTSFHPELAGDYRFHRWFLSEFVVGDSASPASA